VQTRGYFFRLAGAVERFSAPGFGRNVERNLSSGKVLITSRFSNHPRRAIETP
jgi:hypothetical protein